MIAWKLSTLFLFSLRALNAFAEIEVENVEEVVGEQAQSPNLKVSISASFPQSEIFGVKLINGHATQARLSIDNQEPEAVTVQIVGGSLIKDAGDQTHILRNLTGQRYGLEIPAGEEQTLTYSFATEMHPQDVRLQLVAVLQDKKSAFYTISVYNETVSIVEAPTSIFDPQIIFLYLVLLGAFGGTVFFIYNTWITTLFPQQRRGGKGGERAKKSSGGSKKVDPAEQVSVVGADGPAVAATGSKSYDQSWIPAQHLQRPEAKRVRSGTPKTKVKS
ncbi:Increased recombination centers protein 22 [Didymosphaeria variabile]|uniref:Increased recombination centers protein 22 n=1 Tax=Didymosphaeria variabile TaxID=1932322 RepID=A0A9W8XQV0_9PLEO|nr:Increased recombination centers protein 22 [Didymosphaeria variabile]KAJ4356647.1 Increased recombination centers protein 22 [Didymosphaeria variabile]